MLTDAQEKELRENLEKLESKVDSLGRVVNRLREEKETIQRHFEIVSLELGRERAKTIECRRVNGLTGKDVELHYILRIDRFYNNSTEDRESYLRHVVVDAIECLLQQASGISYVRELIKNKS